MNIDKLSHRCFHCGIELETLPHIFLHCKKSLDFASMVERWIINNILDDYLDPKKFFYITCSHDNKIINYILAVTKLYISIYVISNKRKIIFPTLDFFLSDFLLGEKEPILSTVKVILGFV